MNPFESFRRASGRAADPIARAAVRLGIGANAITTVGGVVVLGAAVAMAGGAVRWGGGLMLAAGAFDLLDGRVARLAGRATSFGAFYDATMDRVSEAVLSGGMVLYFLRGGAAPDQVPGAVMLTVVALALALLASYARARAAALGVAAPVGLPSAASRFGILGLGPLILGAAALVWLIGAWAVVGVVTLLQRIIYVARADAGAAPAGRKRHTLPGRAQPLRREH